MNEAIRTAAISPLRQRMIDDMNVRRFSRGTQRNTLTGGGTWTENCVTEQQVMDRYGPTIEAGSPLLWQEASRLVREYFAGRASETALWQTDAGPLPVIAGLYRFVSWTRLME